MIVRHLDLPLAIAAQEGYHIFKQHYQPDTLDESFANSIAQACTYIDSHELSMIEIRYKIEQPICRLMDELNLRGNNFGICVGSNLQQVIHNEFVVSVNSQAPYVNHQIDGLPYKPYVSNVIRLCSVGIEFNTSGDLLSSSRIANFCNQLANYGKAVILGVADGVRSIADNPSGVMQNMAIMLISTNPIGLAATIGGLGYTAGRAAYTAWNEAEGDFGRLTKTLATKLKEFTTPEGVRTATAFSTRLLIEAKLTHRCFKICRMIKPWISKGFEKLSQAVTSPAVNPGPTLAVAVEGLPVATVANDATNVLMLETEQIASSAALEVVETHVGQADSRVEMPSSLYHQLEFGTLEEYQTELKTHIPYLEQYAASLVSNIESLKNVVDKIDVEHIFMFRIYKDKMKGFHHDLMNRLQSGNIVTCLNKRALTHSGVETNVLYNSIVYPRKTLFPSNWSRELVIEKILEASQNLTLPASTEGKSMVLEGLTTEDIKIKIVIDLLKRVVKTAYPIKGTI